MIIWGDVSTRFYMVSSVNYRGVEFTLVEVEDGSVWRYNFQIGRRQFVGKTEAKLVS